MFEPLTIEHLARAGDDARIYCRPTAPIDRPHEWEGRCFRLSDSLIWFSAWQLSLRGADGPTRHAIVTADGVDAWLNAMPGALAENARAQMAAVGAPRAPLRLGERQIRLSEPQIVGILNATPDSFSDGGKHVDVDAALAAAVAMTSAGAAIIDVGGESTRPGAPLLWEGDEWARVDALIRRLAATGAAISIDTRKAMVMEQALATGAAMINDVSALAYDDRAVAVAAAADVPVVLMHAPSQSSNPHDLTPIGGAYRDILFDVYDWFAAQIARVTAAGVARGNIILDPGIGFGKGVEDGLRLLNGLSLFHTFGCPIMVGGSRKRMIGALDNEAAVDQRLGGSVALHLLAATQGVQLLRVHDVAETRQALRLWRGLRDSALTAI